MLNLADANLKLARAQQHIDTLRNCVQTIGETKMHALRIESASEPGKHILWAKRITEIPREWGITIGEFAHNARSALDMLVFQLSSLDQSDTRRLRLQFPIFRDPKKYRREAGDYLCGVGPAEKALIESMQPCNGSGPIDDNALWLLAKINNADKHHIIPVITACSAIDSIAMPAARVGRSRVWVTLPHGTSIGGEFSYKPIGDGAISENERRIAEVISGPQAKMDVKLRFTTEIRFGERGYPFDGRPVIRTFTLIIGRVKEVIGQFECSGHDSPTVLGSTEKG